MKIVLIALIFTIFITLTSSFSFGKMCFNNYSEICLHKYRNEPRCIAASTKVCGRRQNENQCRLFACQLAFNVVNCAMEFTDPNLVSALYTNTTLASCGNIPVGGVTTCVAAVG